VTLSVGARGCAATRVSTRERDRVGDGPETDRPLRTDSENVIESVAALRVSVTIRARLSANVSAVGKRVRPVKPSAVLPGEVLREGDRVGDPGRVESALADGALREGERIDREGTREALRCPCRRAR
jgi:hypothetical protein